jgi:hypothetical protein
MREPRPRTARSLPSGSASRWPVGFIRLQSILPLPRPFDCDIKDGMTSKALKEAIQRAETWPEAAQEQLAEIAFEIDAELKGGAYRATSEELAGIDRGLRAANEGRFATDEEVEAVFVKRRGA